MLRICHVQNKDRFGIDAASWKAQSGVEGVGIENADGRWWEIGATVGKIGQGKEGRGPVQSPIWRRMRDPLEEGGEERLSFRGDEGEGFGMGGGGDR